MAEEKNIATGYIGNALRSSAADHTTTFTDEVFDTDRQKYQSEVNTDIEERIEAEAQAIEAVVVENEEQTQKLSELEEEIKSLSGGKTIHLVSCIFREEPSIWKFVNEYVQINENISNTHARAIIEPISLKENDKIIVTTAGYATSIALLIATNSEGKVIKDFDNKFCIIYTTNISGTDDIEFIAPKDCLVYLNRMDNRDFSCVLEKQYKGEIESLKENIASLETNTEKLLPKVESVDYELKKVTTSKNLYNFLTDVDNTIINRSTGEVIHSDNYKTSDYISINGQFTIPFQRAFNPDVLTGAFRIAFYRNDKSFIRQVDELNGVQTITPPTSTSYMRISSHLKSYAYMVNYGDSLEEYESFKVNVSKSEYPVFDVKNYKGIEKSAYITTKGVINSSSNYFITDYIACNGGDSFTLKQKSFIPTGNTSVVFLDENKLLLNSIPIVTAEQTFSVPIHAKYARFSIPFSEYKTFELYLNVLHEIKEYSKNIWNGETDKWGVIIDNDGIETTTNDNYKMTEFIAIGSGNAFSFPVFKPSEVQQGSIGCQAICTYDKDKNFIGRTTMSMNGYANSYTMKEGEEYVRLQLYSWSGDIMINLGSELLNYEPYGESRYVGDFEEIGNKVNAMFKAPVVNFDIDHELKDVSSILGDTFDFSQKYNTSNMLEQIYNAFDGLIAEHPNYITKYDAAELAGIPYPEYAKGYNGVPEYKLYMYKLAYSDDLIASSGRKKLFIVGGLHGDEIAAPVNIYMFAKQLCECADANFAKLRMVYDIYLLPCVNGYGMYKLTRYNINKVNLNRNYPTHQWREQGKGTIDVVGKLNDYTGPTAGSEFETQVVIAITDYIKPDLAIDHHNYSSSDRQWYGSSPFKEYLPLAYQSNIDCAFTFIKGFPQYFGTKWQMFYAKNGNSSPNVSSDKKNATLSLWWSQHGVAMPFTIEICENINYRNGELVNERVDDFGNDSFAVAEYTLRNQILIYSNYLFNKVV